MYSTNCPVCGNRIVYRADAAGGTSKCDRCGEIVKLSDLTQDVVRRAEREQMAAKAERTAQLMRKIAGAIVFCAGIYLAGLGEDLASIFLPYEIFGIDSTWFPRLAGLAAMAGGVYLLATRFKSRN